MRGFLPVWLFKGRYFMSVLLTRRTLLTSAGVLGLGLLAGCDNSPRLSLSLIHI